MDKYIAIEILKLYADVNLNIVTGYCNKNVTEILENRNKLILKAQEVLLADDPDCEPLTLEELYDEQKQTIDPARQSEDTSEEESEPKTLGEYFVEMLEAYRAEDEDLPIKWYYSVPQRP